MPKLVKNKAYGVFQNGFFAAIDDYPIAGGWGLNRTACITNGKEFSF